MIQTKFKQTEVGEIPEGWAKFPFPEVIEVDPKRELRKGSQAKFVSMADLKEFNKKIQGFITREFKGGSKFVNEDTLMARITPCLENGKTVFVDILEKEEVASGSTEFIVLGAKENKTIPEFVYYLAISPEVRAQAIQSMTGTSGRQRVDPDIFDKILINIPKISEQRAIAKILSDLDEKIELNHQMNKTLESIAQAIFKRWFVDFEFLWHEKSKFVKGLPRSWEIRSIGDVLELAYGKALKEDRRQPGNIPVYGSNGQVGWNNVALVKGPGIVIGRKGNPGIVTWAPTDFFPIDTSFYIVIKDVKLSMYYLLHALLGIDLASLGADSAVPGLNRNIAYNTEILVPSAEALK